jgi:hypothetical protein
MAVGQEIYSLRFSVSSERSERARDKKIISHARAWRP